VAINLQAWGCKTGIIGIVGVDDNAKELSSLLNEKNITHFWIEMGDRPTTVKTRVVASSHHLLRIDEESNQYITGAEEDRALDSILQSIDTFDPQLIILEDYNKGLLTEKIIEGIIKHTRSKDIFISVDPKEINFFTYRNVNLFKPNLREASHAFHSPIQPDTLPVVSSQWRKDNAFETLAITLGGNGVFLQNGQGGVQVTPDRAIDVIDVCGAGDAVVCAISLGLMAGLDLQKAGSLANLSGAYVCSHSGVVAVNVDAIYQWI
jgi:rfaE bifunctional protein kinase chain/domain